MRRTQIQLDERTYGALRRVARERGQSMSEVAREVIARGLPKPVRKRRLTLKDFTSIGAGASDDGPLAPVSVRHDEALAGRGPSMPSVARESIAKDPEITSPPRRLTLKDFSSIGIASRDDGPLAPVSERHDEALAEALYEELRDDARRYVRHLRLGQRKRSPSRPRR